MPSFLLSKNSQALLSNRDTNIWFVVTVLLELHSWFWEVQRKEWATCFGVRMVLLLPDRVMLNENMFGNKKEVFWWDQKNYTEERKFFFGSNIECHVKEFGIFLENYGQLQREFKTGNANWRGLRAQVRRTPIKNFHCEGPMATWSLLTIGRFFFNKNS